MTDATPNVPATTSTNSSGTVKVINPYLIILKDETIPVDTMADLVFEDIGGQELINITRHDLVNGVDVLYQPIKNISSIYFQYNPQNILRLQSTSDTYFNNFPLKFSDKVPNYGTGPDGDIVYVDKDGNLVINAINVGSGEQVEVQILVHGEAFNATIYTWGF